MARETGNRLLVGLGGSSIFSFPSSTLDTDGDGAQERGKRRARLMPQWMTQSKAKQNGRRLNFNLIERQRGGGGGGETSNPPNVVTLD